MSRRRASFFGPPRPEPGPIEVVWIGSPNYASRAGWVPRYLVIHTMDGTLAGCDSWFKNPASQVSAHYGVSLEGVVHQYVDLGAAAWANGILEAGNRWPGPNTNPNNVTVSIETEDDGDPQGVPVSDALYQAVLDVGALVLAAYPGITGLMTHAAISPQSRAGCPGDRWVASEKFAALAEALGLTPIY
jgi:N-acetylmuramoyl-L-alanine amidase